MYSGLIILVAYLKKKSSKKWWWLVWTSSNSRVILVSPLGVVCKVYTPQHIRFNAPIPTHLRIAIPFRIGILQHLHVSPVRWWVDCKLQAVSSNGITCNVLIVFSPTCKIIYSFSKLFSFEEGKIFLIYDQLYLNAWFLDMIIKVPKL